VFAYLFPALILREPTSARALVAVVLVRCGLFPISTA
jgi:hypothetical protein